MDLLTLSELMGLACVLVLILVIIIIAIRRSALTRSGAIDVCWRRDLTPDGRGWILGQGRFRDNEFRLYRSFSPLPGVAGKLHRDSLKLGARRPPVGTEPDLLPVESVILQCTDAGAQIELAVSEEALTGLRSWLESLPPATRSVKLFQRGIRND